MTPTLQRQARDLPITSTWTFDDVRVVKAVLRSLEVGDVVRFERAAMLCDTYGADDRIGALLETRVEALSSQPHQVTPAAKTEVAAKVATEVSAGWKNWLPDAEVKRLHEWGLNIGFGIGELTWELGPTRWTPRFRTWDPRHVEYRWKTRSFWVDTMDGQVEVTPGDGHWVLYLPHGASRPWMKGLVRPFARLYLMRSWSQRDWARWCEVHGMPIRQGIVPTGAEPSAKAAYLNDLLNLGGEATILTEQDENGRGYGVKLVEAASSSWQGFQALLDKVDEATAIRVLGQTLTTSTEGKGSNALGRVQNEVRLERLEGDSQALGACVAEQVVKPWVVINTGREDLVPSCGWQTNTNASVDPTTALNGAQVTALINVLEKTAQEQLPRETAVQVLEACFPLTLEQAEKIVGAIGKGFKPAPAAPAPAKQPAVNKNEDATDDA